MRATKTGKRLASIFLLAAMVLMLLAGCGKSEPTEKNGETDPTPKQTEGKGRGQEGADCAGRGAPGGHRRSQYRNAVQPGQYGV